MLGRSGRSLVSLLSATLALSACAVTPGEAGDQEPVSSSSQEILNGEEITTGQFPTVVGVVVGQGGLCTGTLVAPDVVITAAHCISPAVFGGTQSQITQQTQVVLDSENVFSGQGRSVGATATIPHPAFTRPGQPDIGIIKLDTRITDREPTPLNTDPDLAPIGVSVKMVGYGLNEQGASGIGAWLKDRTSTACAPYGVSDESFICFSQTSGTGKCSGDSGGPSFADVDGRDVLVGITSFGDQECQFFGADYRVDHARQFIADNAPELLCVEDGLCDEKCGDVNAGQSTDPDCKPPCATDSDCENGGWCTMEGSCEPAPFSPGGLGADCSEGQPACVSGLCANTGDGSVCTSSCTQSAECPDGFKCTQVEGGGGACIAEEGGCQSTSSPAAPLGVMFGLLGLLFATRRRRNGSRA